jgi:hypothetical protein
MADPSITKFMLAANHSGVFVSEFGTKFNQYRDGAEILRLARTEAAKA